MFSLKHFASLLMSIILILMFTACGNDDEGIRLQDVIIGTWSMDRYEIESEEEIRAEITIDYFLFQSDNSFTVHYLYDDPEDGIYEAGNDYIRLEYTGTGGETRKVLCRVLSFNDTDLTVRYEDSDQNVFVTVWLTKR